MALWGQLNIDGSFGPLTREYLQRFLAHQGFYVYAFDGVFGTLSVKALQRYINEWYYGYHDTTVVVDGVAGPKTWGAWWDFLNHKGYWDGGLVYDSQPIPQNIGAGTTRMTQKMLNFYRVNRRVDDPTA